MACALALEPRALLLDEPMAGIGAGGTHTLTDRLAALKSRVPILLVEHDMDAVFRLADRISVLVAGEVIASGTPDTIRADSRVRDAYLGEAP
jgi:branched-chain amino acid transport system ATP-binding protein